MLYHLGNEVREGNGKNSEALIVEKMHGILGLQILSICGLEKVTTGDIALDKRGLDTYF